jgi:hypothetical protein
LESKWIGTGYFSDYISRQSVTLDKRNCILTAYHNSLYCHFVFYYSGAIYGAWPTPFINVYKIEKSLCFASSIYYDSTLDYVFTGGSFYDSTSSQNYLYMIIFDALSSNVIKEY